MVPGEIFAANGLSPEQGGDGRSPTVRAFPPEVTRDTRPVPHSSVRQHHSSRICLATDGYFGSVQFGGVMNGGAANILEHRNAFLLGILCHSFMELTPDNANHPVLFLRKLIFLLGPFHLLEYFLTEN